MSDAPEIIARPPSHPTATTLILASVIGTIAAIGFVYAELFTEYLPSQAPGQPQDQIMAKHAPVQHANAPNPIHDHYAEDFGSGDVLQGVESDLGLSTDIGNVPAGEALPANDPAPPAGDVEAPDGQ